jgi:hypothetical protein
MPLRGKHCPPRMPSEAGAVDRFSDDARNGIVFLEGMGQWLSRRQRGCVAR